MKKGIAYQNVVNGVVVGLKKNIKTLEFVKTSKLHVREYIVRK
jgi:hypothetical protein